MFRVTSLFSAAVLIAFAAGADPLEVRLAVEPATTLPGIGVTIRATFKNTTGKPIAMPTGAALVVTPDHGPRFIALAGSGTIVPLDGGPVGSQDVIYEFTPDGRLGTPGWFYFEFTRPGTYGLQLVAGDYSDDKAWLETAMRQARAASNVVTLTVAEPVGVDAEVWKAMKALADTPENWKAADIYTTAGNELAARIVRDYPDSVYTGWIATMGSSKDPDAAFEPLKAWMKLHPDDPYREQRLLRVGIFEANSAILYQRTDPAKSRQHEAAARELLGKLRDSRSSEVRKEAAERVASLDEIRDRGVD